MQRVTSLRNDFLAVISGREIWVTAIFCGNQAIFCGNMWWAGGWFSPKDAAWRRAAPVPPRNWSDLDSLGFCVFLRVAYLSDVQSDRTKLVSCRSEMVFIFLFFNDWSGVVLGMQLCWTMIHTAKLIDIRFLVFRRYAQNWLMLTPLKS